MSIALRRLNILCLMVILFACLQSCGTIKKGYNAIPLLPDIPLAEEKEIPNPPSPMGTNEGFNYSKLFYVCGALCFLVGVGILVVMKDMKTSGMAFLGGLGFCTAPAYIDVLHEILGGLKWALYACLVVGVICFVIWVFYKMKLILHDLHNTEEEDKCKETGKVRQSLNKSKDKKKG